VDRGDASRRRRRGVDIESVASTTLRRGAAAVAVVGSALSGSLPLLVARGLPTLEVTLALAASVIVLAALLVAPSLLPAAVTVYGAELVVSVHRGEFADWVIPLLAVCLLLVYEGGDLRHRLPSRSVVEPAAVRALRRRVALTTTLGLLGSAAVIAAADVSSRGGPAAVIVGGVAAIAAVVLVRVLAVTHADTTSTICVAGHRGGSEGREVTDD